MAEAPVLTSRADDFPCWYRDLITKAEFADKAPVRGTMVIRPYGYGLWERMQAETGARIQETGTQSAYFPLRFAPEPAVGTHGGGKELEGRQAGTGLADLPGLHHPHDRRPGDDAR